MTTITYQPLPPSSMAPGSSADSPLSSVAGSSGVGDASAAGAFSYLTPDALLAYCQTKLQSTDSQMEHYFQNEQTDASNQTVLTKLEGQISALTANGFDSGKTHDGMDLIADCQSAIANVGGPDTPTGQQIVALRDSIAKAIDITGHLQAQLDAPGGGETVVNQYKAWLATVPPDQDHDADYIKTHGGPNDGQGIAANTVQGWLTSAQSIGSNIGNDSQMGMIQLQSLMSDRQTSIQMCTNLVQSLADQAKDIATNIGH